MSQLSDSIEPKVRELGRAQGALNTIGNILWTRHHSRDYQDLTKGDIEGLCLAVVSIADLMDTIVEDMDHSLMDDAMREAKQ